MLRIVQTSITANAKSYFRGMHLHEDTYTGPELAVGVWQGKLAESLGLVGKIRDRDWSALCDNRHPGSGESLTARNVANRTVAYDFNFNCPKSVSIVAALGGDRDIEQAMVEAMRETMAEVEAKAQTRVRRDGQDTNRDTGNLVWGEYIHRTARPVKGFPDMHLHGHCFVFNVTEDPVEGFLKAVQFRDLKRDALFYEAKFHSRLAQKVMDLGYQIETKGRFWEIAGVPDRLIQEFSQRKGQVERMAADKGVNDPDRKADLGRRTRVTKDDDLSNEEIADNWQSRLQPGDLESLGRLRGSGGCKDLRRSDADIARHAMGRLFERTAVVTEKRLLSEAVRLCWDASRLPEIQAECERRGLIRKEIDGVPMVTTQAVYKEEKLMVQMAKDGAGRFRPIRSTPVPEGKYDVSGEQLGAVNHVLLSTDSITMVEGVAGTGKTRILKTLEEEVKRSMGVAGGPLDRFVVLAPTSRAAREVLADEGFPQATTVAKFLTETEGMCLAKTVAEKFVGRVIAVDEAPMLGISDMVRLQNVARKMGARLVLLGSEEQNHAVAKGGVFSTLRMHAGVEAAKLTEVLRQKGEYKAAVEAFNEGAPNVGFDRLEAMGAIRQVEPDKVAKAAARDYVDTLKAGKSVGLVTPTHEQKNEVTAEVRSLLKEDKTIRRERTFQQLVRVDSTEEDRRRESFYKPGQVIQFHQNVRGYKAGTRWKVEGHTMGRVTLSADTSVEKDLHLKSRLSNTAYGFLPVGKADCFDVYERKEIQIGVGDRIRITKNGKTFSVKEMVLNQVTGATKYPKRELNNGAGDRVKRFTRDGGLQLENGLYVAKSYAHLEHEYCSTAVSTQGKTLDRIIVLQTAASGQAGSLEQFNSSITRGRESVVVYTEDKERLRSAVSRSSRPMGAMDLVYSDNPYVQEGFKKAMEQEEAFDRSYDDGKDGFERA